MQNGSKFNARKGNRKMSNILEQLKKFVADDPEDPFNHYALALEYLKGDTDAACRIFEQLVEQHGNYVPTYYHLGKLYLDLQRRDDAVRMFERGIAVARNANDMKAVRELEAARLEALYD